MTEGVDWLGILDGFDPSRLEQKYLDECARRDPYSTCYKWDRPARPVEERQQHLLFGHERRRLELCVKRIENEGLTLVGYWLEADYEETLYGVDEELTAQAAEHREPWSMYATNRVIREWWMEQQKRRPNWAKED